MEARVSTWVAVAVRSALLCVTVLGAAGALALAQAAAPEAPGAVALAPAAPGAVALAPSALSPDDVLSWHSGQFFLEGKPFAEISFNKFDLFWQLWAEALAGNDLDASNPKYVAQQEALRELAGMGMRTIRFFALPWSGLGFAGVFSDPVSRETVFFKAMDAALDLCDKSGIKVVYCLGCADFTDKGMVDGKWVLGPDQLRELVANPSSASRARLYNYLDTVVARYKNRKTIAMWEITNELTLAADIQPGTRIQDGERMPTLKDVAAFYDDVAKRIKAIDGVRMVNNGGSNLRESAWHLLNNKGWTKDTLADQTKAFDLLFANSAVDVVDIHYYQVAGRGYVLQGEKGKTTLLDLKGYAKIAATIGKPLMVGEYGALPELKATGETWKVAKDYFEGYDDNSAAKWVQMALDDVVDAGVPLTYWWCYQSDREQEQGLKNRFDLDIDRNPELLKLFVDANHRLKDKLGVAE